MHEKLHTPESTEDSQLDVENTCSNLEIVETVDKLPSGEKFDREEIRRLLPIEDHQSFWTNLHIWQEYEEKAGLGNLTFEDAERYERIKLIVQKLYYSLDKRRQERADQIGEQTDLDRKLRQGKKKGNGFLSRFLKS